MLGSILLTLVIFLAIIFIHELGHFLVAKWSGVRVNEFALGMGPAIISRQWGETLYSIRAFPIGGFCSMEGEDNGSDDPRAFCNIVVWKRILVVIAGALMNLLLGFVLIVGITAASDVITSNTVASFSEGASSEASGLQAGDTIQKINGRSVRVENDIAYELLRDDDGVVDMTVQRDGKSVDLKNVVFTMTEGEDGTKSLTIDFKVVGQETSFGNVLSYSFRKSASVARLVWISLLDLVTGHASLNDLAGPIGMTQVVGQAAKVGASSLLLLAAFITINVGIFNLLPIPALDGGRLFFLLVEVIRRKRIKPEYEAYVHLAGFALLILLMIVVAFNDIWRLIS
ncbi:MAG: RIP metalloprotease RseP [Candidatus Merdivicinus sp.]|jgi:regulator of sigma E protease